MHWVELYTTAILERDPAKFPVKAEAARRAISAELQVVSRREDMSALPEKRALEEALHNLRFLTAA